MRQKPDMSIIDLLKERMDDLFEYGEDGLADCGQKYRITPKNRYCNGGDAVTLTCERCIRKLKKEMKYAWNQNCYYG